MSNNGVLVTFYYTKNEENSKLYRIEKIEYNGELIYYSPLVNGTYDTSKVGTDWSFVPFHVLGISEQDENNFINLISSSVYDTVNYKALDKITDYIREEFEAKQVHKSEYKSDEIVANENDFIKKSIGVACGHNCSSCSACSACSRAFSK